MPKPIKTCPFCGGISEFNGESYDIGGQVECTSEDCQTIGPFRVSVEAAIDVWNKRYD